MPATSEAAPRVTWQTAPGCEEPRLDQWLAGDAARVIKHGSHRTVYRVDLPDRTLYVKHYRCQPWFGVWRHLLRASQSRREWHKTLEVARRRIPTAPPVAIGEVQHGPLVRDNYYVSEGIVGAASLDDYLRSEPRLTTRRRRQIITAVAGLAAEAHAQGIDHNDFHTGNLLIRWSADQPESPPALYLIDLPGVRFRRSLNWRRSRDSLAMLGGGWLLQLSRTDRWRFWQSYLAARPHASQSFPSDAAAQILARMWRHARAIAAMRDKRPLRSNRDFRRVRSDDARAHGVIELKPEHLQALAADPAAPLRRHRNAPVKISHASLLVEASLPLGDQTTAVAYKRSRTNSWWKRLLSPLRRSRAIAGWQTGHALLARGIATARPLAAIQPRTAVGGESYLATAWLAGALNLHLYLWQLAESDPQDRDRRAARAAESLGRLLGRMHAWHVSHRDLKGCNLVVREQSGQTEAYLIDLEGVRFTGGLGDSRRARDLARLAASMEAHSWLTRGVRLRFLRAYLRQLPSARPAWKPLWRRVALETGRFLADFQRRGRPVA